MNELQRAKTLLVGDVTCVILNGNEVYTSKKRGISPLLELLDSGKPLKGAVAADKIVGKAAALLYTHMGISTVYGEVMTTEAQEILTSHGIVAECTVSAEKIINRRGDGICPMEEVVLSISSPAQAVLALREKLASMQ